jgi:outer membrane immunogenic protein
MKNLLLATTALASLAAPAMAADMPVKAPAAVVEAAYNWTGLYTASTLGVGNARIFGDFVDPTLPPDRHNSSRSSAWWDSHIGFQYQWNRIVIGIEGTLAVPLSRDYGTSLSPSADCFGASLIANRTCESRIDRIWGIGGRLGVTVWDRTLLYGTGGWATARIQTRDRVTSTGLINVNENQDYWHRGWYAGAGLDWYLTRIWFSDLILGVEYRHYNFDVVRHFPVNVTFSPPIAFAGDVRDVRGRLDVISARLTFKWNPTGAVVARY